MNREKIVPGIILIGIGSLFLLRNMGLIHWWTLGSLWRFWPLILVVIGINTIFNKSTAVAAITWLCFFAVIIGYGLTTPASRTAPWQNVVQVGEGQRSPISIEAPGQVEEAVLTLNTGAMQLTLQETEEALLKVSGFPFQPEYQLNQSSNGKRSEININTSNRNWVHTDGDGFNGLLELKEDLPWTINAKMGAVSAHLDLREIQLKHLSLEVGAGDVRLLMSQPEADAQVTVNAGASQVILELPRDVNARIHARNVLSQTDIDSRYWHREGDTYVSRDYDPQAPSLEITIKMGIGRLEVDSRQ